jgi:hypothetical protein
MPTTRHSTQQSLIATLEATLKSRLSWADGVVSPFALAARPPLKLRPHARRRRRRLSSQTRERQVAS